MNKYAKVVVALKPYAKTVVAVVGLALTVASAMVAPDSTAGHYVTAVIAVLTAMGIYRVPNAVAVPAAVAALKAAQAARKPTPATPGGTA